MLKRFLTLVLVAGLVAASAMAQSTDEIISQHLEARGGVEKIQALDGVRMKGRVLMMGMEMPFVRYSKRPGMMRMEVEFQGQEIVQATDGETAWMKNPMMGGLAKMPEEQAAQMNLQADLDGIFLDPEGKGVEIEYVGTEDVDGKPHYKLKVVAPDVPEMHYFIDTETHLLTKTSSEADNPMSGEKVAVDTYMKSYRTIGGVKMPFTMETHQNGEVFQTVSIESVKANQEMDDAMFAFPEGQ